MPGTGLAEKVKDERSEEGSSLDFEKDDKRDFPTKESDVEHKEIR